MEEWNYQKALIELGITEIPFEVAKANALRRGNDYSKAYGLAHYDTIAINPDGPYKERSKLHEISHIVLGHTGVRRYQREWELGEFQQPLCEIEAETCTKTIMVYLGFSQKLLDYSEEFLADWQNPATRQAYPPWRVERDPNTVELNKEQLVRIATAVMLIIHAGIPIKQERDEERVA